MTPIPFGAEFLESAAPAMSAGCAGYPICMPNPKPRYQLYDLDGDGIPDAMGEI